MSNDARRVYQQSEILDASPTRLIILLYRGAIDAVGRARTHQLNGERRERAHQITRAFEIIVELSGSVQRIDKSETGEAIALRLLQLYDYMQQQLNRANLEQITEPLDEVEKLLGNLLEGWEGASAQLGTSAVRNLAAFAGDSVAASVQVERQPLNVSA